MKDAARLSGLFLMEFEFELVDMGTAMSPVDGKVILDVGNHLVPGVIDHHHQDDLGSASLCVVKRPELISGWLKGKKSNVTIVAHKNPDLDCVVSSYLACHLILFERLPKGCQAVARYVTEIDQGDFKPIDLERPMPYEIFELLRLSCREELQTRPTGLDAERARDLQLLRRGFEMLDVIFDAPPPKESADLAASIVSSGLFEKERAALSRDYELYQSDIRDGSKTSMLSAELPCRSAGSLQATDGLVARDPSSALFKIWARNDLVNSPRHKGFELLLVVYSNALGAQRERARYVISVAPRGWASLKGLGDALNRLEEQALGAAGIPIQGPPRPGYKLSDPWYDGRGHGYTIIDTPIGGTLLDEEAIKSLVLSCRCWL